ncbi:MAG: GNAT family protein [Ginsengibacter sp.]
MNKIFYTQLIVTDYDDYRRIRLESLKQYPDNFGSTYEEELNSQSLKLDSAIKGNGQGNFAMGAFNNDNKLIGICGLVRDLRLKTRHRGEIIQMYIDPAFGGQGIGKTLLRLSIEKAFKNIEIEQIILNVVCTNDRAITLYKKLGFIEYGRLENYFKIDSRYFTQLFFSLAKKDWQARIKNQESGIRYQVSRIGLINPDFKYEILQIIFKQLLRICFSLTIVFLL